LDVSLKLLELWVINLASTIRIILVFLAQGSGDTIDTSDDVGKRLANELTSLLFR